MRSADICWGNKAGRPNSQENGIKSICFLERLTEEIRPSLPGLFREAMGASFERERPTEWPIFPSLAIQAARGEQEQDEVGLLHLTDYSETSKTKLP